MNACLACPLRDNRNMKHVRIAIVGPTSYTALWLLRLVKRHPNVEVTYLASQRDELPHITDEFSLRPSVSMPV